MIRRRQLFALLALIALSAMSALALPRAVGAPVLVVDMVIAFAVLLWLLGTDAWRDALARRRAGRAGMRTAGRGPDRSGSAEPQP